MEKVRGRWRERRREGGEKKRGEGQRKVYVKREGNGKRKRGDRRKKEKIGRQRTESLRQKERNKKRISKNEPPVV